MIILRTIKPAVAFQSSVFREDVKEAFNVLSVKVKRDFYKTTATWKNPPIFDSELNMGAAVGGIQGEIYTKDKRYKFVDEGTRVRRAVMSKDFLAKTRPRFIGSGPGRGRVVFISKKISRPGIKAREFTKIIYRKYVPVFRQEIQNALDRAARRSGRGRKR